MARYTEKAILATFEEMLETMPFDKITVLALTKNCDISPNTFYYHYKDIYELLEEWIGKVTKNFLDGRPKGEKWDEAFKAVLGEFRSRPNIVRHIFDSRSRDYTEQYTFKCIKKAFLHILQRNAEGRNVEEKVLVCIADICGYAMLGFILRFISSGMKLDENEVIDEVNTAINTAVEMVVFKRLADEIRITF